MYRNLRVFDRSAVLERVLSDTTERIIYTTSRPSLLYSFHRLPLACSFPCQNNKWELAKYNFKGQILKQFLYQF